MEILQLGVTSCRAIGEDGLKDAQHGQLPEHCGEVHFHHPPKQSEDACVQMRICKAYAKNPRVRSRRASRGCTRHTAHSSGETEQL